MRSYRKQVYYDKLFHAFVNPGTAAVSRKFKSEPSRYVYVGAYFSYSSLRAIVNPDGSVIVKRGNNVLVVDDNPFDRLAYTNMKRREAGLSELSKDEFHKSSFGEKFSGI